jgi:hypothetical protein
MHGELKRMGEEVYFRILFLHEKNKQTKKNQSGESFSAAKIQCIILGIHIKKQYHWNNQLN